MSNHDTAERFAHLNQPHWTPVVIRAATAADRAALEHLAELDSTQRPSGPVLLAQLGDRVVAALELTTGRVIASPFVPTSDIQELLRLRASQQSQAPGGSSAVRRWRRLARSSVPADRPDRPPGLPERTAAA
jgi:hypothetical protein